MRSHQVSAYYKFILKIRKNNKYDVALVLVVAASSITYNEHVLTFIGRLVGRNGAKNLELIKEKGWKCGLNSGGEMLRSHIPRKRCTKLNRFSKPQ